MKICIVMSLKMPPEDGIGNYVSNLSQKLHRKGHDVTVITRGSLRTAQKEDYGGVQVFKVPFLPVYPFHVQVHGFFLKNFLKDNNGYDVLHYHTPLPPPVKTGLPVLTTVHTLVKPECRSMEVNDSRALAARFQSRVSTGIERDLFNMSDKITCVSNSVADELRSYGIRPEDAEVISNGVDETLFTPAKTKGGEKYVLYTGRLSYRKGLFDLVESGKMIFGRYPDVHYKIVGKGPLLDKLSKAIQASGYADRFELLGHVEKGAMIDLYRNAAVFVQPSHYEGLPTTLLEAMACGAPVVATAICGNLDVIEPGRNGLLVPARSPESIAKAVSSLMDDADAGDALGKAARRTIEEKYTWDIIANKVLRCYSSIT